MTTESLNLEAAHQHAHDAHQRASDAAFELRRTTTSFAELRLAAMFAANDLLTTIEIAQCYSPTFAALLARKLAGHLESRREQDEKLVARAERKAARA